MTESFASFPPSFPSSSSSSSFSSSTLVIDQGIHSTRALAFEREGRLRAAASRPVSLCGAGTAEIMRTMEQTMAQGMA